MKIELTLEEANELIRLLNIAVKAGGLESNVAENGVYFAKKLKQAFAAPPSVEQ
jgi:hypothetical protein